MKYADVAKNVRQLLDELPPQDEFIYELLLAYGKPKASITRLKQGTYNQSKVPGEVLWKKEVYFKSVDGDLFAAIEELKTAKGTKTHHPRFLFVTDFEQILAVDRKTDDSLDIKFQALETNFDFFLPWAGMEKTKLSNENPADVKAAEKMAKLFDAIKLDNPQYLRHDAHSMNVFLGRLLFCLFAEDTGIFPENAVTNAVASHTDVDGSDLNVFFKRLFDLLDTPDNKRGTIEEHLKCFPYVNGGLFRDHFDIPDFSAKSRRMIIESGELNWSEINPDIFGSMFQAVIDPEERHNLGQHYTSVTNIMKVIEPLFLNDLKEQFEVANNRAQNKKRVEELHQLLERIWNLKIFDPACGSGNFLIIAYKELRRLEMEIFEALNEFPVSKIQVDQFFGIEIDDFACETAILALWLAEHQMNLEFTKRFGHSLTSLPLKDGANIVCGNATRIDWEETCPKNDGDEIYILGNPPYLGFKMQGADQKADISSVFKGVRGFKKLDYIACWLLKASEYIREINAQFAFVSTNSICQGEHVSLLWPHVFGKGLEIGFAHKSFKWVNNAKGGAAVICIVVGVRNISSAPKWLFNSGVKRSTPLINAYLSTCGNVVVYKRSKPLSMLPPMTLGNMPKDDGNLILSTEQKDFLVSEHPESLSLVRKLIGANEMMKGLVRWCLWITDSDLDDALEVPQVKERIEKVKQFRLNSSDQSANKMARTPHKFREQHVAQNISIIVPTVTSERRDYIPMGYLDRQTVIVAPNNAIYDPDSWVFGVISSCMHMAWVRAVAGRLKTDYRYSSALCYNTFPVPVLKEEQKQTITMHVMEVLEARENHSQKTMAQLYDPDKMPDDLREAHHNLDLAVDRIYRTKPFASDEERLEHLFALYEKMTAKEKLV